MSEPAWMTFESKDPTASLRFVPPTQAPPYRSLNLTLKQCDIRTDDPVAAQALNLFSSYAQTWEQNRGRHILEAEEMLASMSAIGSEYEVRSDRRPDRRFSGDGYLSRSRYFSLCRDDGADEGTMLRELATYHEPLSAGPIEIRDLTEEPPLAQEGLAGHSKGYGEDSPGILISVPPYTATRHDWLQEAVSRWETTNVLVPVRIVREQFERAIDLRDPVVAAWFTYQLTRLRWIAGDGRATSAFPNKQPLTEFADLLPSLLVQATGGGNGVTRVAGQWLRALGADALVFPSARSDSRVIAGSQAVQDYYGWNVLDYRGALPPRLQTFDMTPEWPTRVSDEINEEPLPYQFDIFLQREVHGSAGGSWAWRGIEVSNLAPRLLSTALYLYDWAREGISEEQRTELVLFLGYTDQARVLVETSAFMIAALLDEGETRREVVALVADTLTQAQARLFDFPGTFELMDARLAAGRSGKLSQ